MKLHAFHIIPSLSANTSCCQTSIIITTTTTTL